MVNSTIVDGNLTCCLEESTNARYFTAATLTLACLVIGINGVVATSAGLFARKNPGRMKATYMLLASLATSDTLTGVTLFIAELIPLRTRTLAICLGILGFVVAAQLASAFFIVIIGIDRYILIACPFQYLTIVTSKRVKCAVAAAFSTSFIIGFLPAFGWRSQNNHVGKPCSYISLAAKECVIFTVIIGTILPLTVTIILNSLLFLHARKFLKKRKSLVIGLKPKGRTYSERSNSMSGSSVSISMSLPTNNTMASLEENKSEASKSTLSLKESSRKTKKTTASERRCSDVFKTLSGKMNALSPELRRTATTIFLLVGAYCCTTLPFFIGSVMSALTDDPVEKDRLTQFTDTKLSFLGFFNSLLNPLLYAWWHRGFRQGMIRKFTRKFSPPRYNDSCSAH